MARPPEQRSTAGPSTPGAPAPHATGNEVFETAAATGEPETTAETPEEQLSVVQQLATEYYEKLSETASQLTAQAQSLYGQGSHYARRHPASLMAAAAAVGVVIGFLTKRN